VFDEPFGVSASNEDTDNFGKDPIYAEISEIKNTAASTTNDPLRKTTRNAIAKPTPRSLPQAAKKIQLSSNPNQPFKIARMKPRKEESV